ncbi:MAG: hypothetical protein ACK2U9_03890, partial [Anaerolineae bacterium]
MAGFHRYRAFTGGARRHTMADTIRVAAQSRSTAVAGAIAGVVRE